VSLDTRLLRGTLEVALARDGSFPRRFYERLFQAHPELASMFTRNSPGAQHKMFAQKLMALVDHLEEPSWMGRELLKLARSHAEYGVTPLMYLWVGDALIETLAEACGEDWSEAAEQAWRRAYDSLSRAMIDPSS
jgi:hemoglobin-like flavoprotein